MRNIYLLLIMGIFSFFGVKGQHKGKDNIYTNMNDVQREQYRSELQRDESKDFNKEFIRTTNLEFSLISTYGFDAVKLIFENRNSSNFYLLGNLPEDCPWYPLNKLSNKNFIETNFKAIFSKIPDMVSVMKERCLLIYAEKTGIKWQLHYLLKMKLYDNRDYYRVYTGGAPVNRPRPNEMLLRYGWELPQDLIEFYQIHDGFGEVYDHTGFVLGCSDLKVMAETLNDESKEQDEYPEGYSFEDLLEFFPDGSGNAQCFFRKKNGKWATVDWDHESWEISEEVGFYSFINKRLSELDEE